MREKHKRIRPRFQFLCLKHRILSSYLLIVMLLMVVISTGNASENKKLAQSGFQFLSVVSDARGAALAEAMTSIESGSSALFFNPAGMSNLEGLVEVSGSTNEWIADIRHNALSLALSPSGGRYGVLGLSLQSVDYGEFYGTRVEKGTDLGYVDTEIFSLSSMAVGLGYAKRLNDRFSVGGQVRWVRQDLGESVVPVISTDLDTLEGIAENALSPLAFDFGTQFKTGYKSLVFGMSVRNFSKEIKYVEEGFQLPLVFNLGISMDVLDFLEDGVPLEQTLYVSIDASHYRSHPEQLKIGMEYGLLGAFWVRGGYVTNNDEDGFSFGMGLRYSGLMFDYAYSPFGVFDKVQRMTVRFSM
jgi:hypothetical protein